MTPKWSRTDQVRLIVQIRIANKGFGPMIEILLKNETVVVAGKRK